MKFKTLNITNYSWEKLKCSATFDSPEEGELKLVLNPELASKILQMCTDEIVTSLQEANKKLIAATLQSVALIEQDPISVGEEEGSKREEENALPF